MCICDFFIILEEYCKLWLIESEVFFGKFDFVKCWVVEINVCDF